jgi:hypothetical protein
VDLLSYLDYVNKLSHISCQLTDLMECQNVMCSMIISNFENLMLNKM